MRLRALFLVVITGYCTLLGTGAAAAQPAPARPSFAIVQLQPGSVAEAFARGSSALEALGYRRLPIPAGREPAGYLRELLRVPGVFSAELDIRVEAARAPNDTFYAGTQAAYLAPLGIEQAWQMTSGAASVTVAVVDTGVDLTHPDLAGRLWVNPGEVPGDGIDNDGNGCIDDVNGCRFLAANQVCGYGSATSGTGLVADDHGAPGQLSHSHGTLAAGIAGARGNNGLGVSGVAWDVRIMPVKVLDCGPLGASPSGTMFDVAQAIAYATANGADVINLSLASQQSSDDLQALRDAIMAARDAGVVVVAAVGNHSGANPGVGLPAAYAGTPGFPNVVAVAASDNRNGNGHATYSNYGPQVTVAAPGYSIAGTVRVAMSPSAAQAYGSETGTSFSTPIVAGAAALIRARNPSLPASEIVAILKATASPAPAGPANWAGAGIVHLGEALNDVPMALSGSALHNWKDVPAGSIVAAVVDDTVCGSDTVSVVNGAATFAIDVQPAFEKDGCGAQGRFVRLFINGSEASPAISWGPPDAVLVVDGEFTSTSPPPGPLVVQSLAEGWNNVAHFADGSALPGAVSYLPAGWTALFAWDEAAGAYDRFAPSAPPYVNTLPGVEPFDPYWVDSTGSTNFAYTNPNLPERTPREVALAAGWNNFVYSGPTRRVDDALGDVAGSYSVVLQYNNATRAWATHNPEAPRALNDFEALLELQVYWVYMTEPGVLSIE